MRINFNSYGLGIGGGNRTIFELSNRLIDRGHVVSITVFGRKNEHRWFEPVKAEVKYAHLSLAQRIFRKYCLKANLDYDYAVALQKIMPDCDVNVATHSFTVYPTLWSVKGRPFYLVQNFEPWFYSGDLSNQFKAELTYSLPLHKLVVSKWLQKEVGGTWIGNGVNLSVFRSGRLKPNTPPYRIMAILRGITWKGDNTILEAYKIVKRELPCRLVVPSHVSDKMLSEIYGSCHVFVFSSRFEGFGLPPLESMACGTPVVVTNCLGVNEYAVHGKNAFVAEQNDPGSLAREIMTVLSNSEATDYIVRGGLETASQHDFEKVVDRFEKAIK